MNSIKNSQNSVVDRSELTRTITSLRHTVSSGRSNSQWRLEQLAQLRRFLVEQEEGLCAALFQDLGKSKTETVLTELGIVMGEIEDLLRRIKRSARRSRVRVPWPLQPASAWVRQEPYGVVLIIAPWNYPLNLTLAPLAGALAAGNTVVLKPSELAQATSSFLAQELPRYFASDVVKVVEGGKEATSSLLSERFDLIVYTGGSRVGKIVAEAAAQHLTPTLLELGGKSPVWVDESVDLNQAARRIVWAKLMNAGQTCVAPDYILCPEAVAEQLETALHEAARQMYGEDLQASPDYGRIISEQAAQRLRKIAGLQEPPEGDSRYVPFRVLRGQAAVPAMEEEIFGPLLPLITVSGPDPVSEAIVQIKGREKPLALYVFSGSSQTRRRFEEETSSGALGLGIANAHLSVPTLPFGGVGGSGYGNYHGPWSLKSFSHQKAVLSKPARPETLTLVYPPLGKAARALGAVLMKKFPPKRSGASTE